MFKKKGNLFLVIALLALVGAYMFITNQDKKKGERNFKSELVSIDMDKATKVVIKSNKNDQPLELNKDGEQWMVTLKDGSKVQAMDNTVESTFKELEGIKTSQVAARSADKWAEYKVDDQGTNVEVYEGANKVLDIILGKFDIDPQSLQQQGGQFGGQSQPKFTSYVRLQGENEVFAVKGFYESINSQTSDNYRDKAMFKANRADIAKINFNYTDTAYQLMLSTDTTWVIDGKAVDSTKVANYISTLSTITGSKFVDQPGSSSLANIVVESKDGKSTTFNAYALPAAAPAEGEEKKEPTPEYVVSSDALTNSYFEGSSVFSRLFVGKGNFGKGKK